jgi:DNA-binding Lrp family transcriptional regulator
MHVEEYRVVNLRGGAVATAFVLVQTEPAKSREVTESLRGVPGVLAADALVGPYDVIARVESEDFDAIGRLVLTEIQRIPGVTRTLTCPTLHF